MGETEAKYAQEEVSPRPIAAGTPTLLLPQSIRLQVIRPTGRHEGLTALPAGEKRMRKSRPGQVIGGNPHVTCRVLCHAHELPRHAAVQLSVWVQAAESAESAEA